MLRFTCLLLFWLCSLGLVAAAEPTAANPGLTLLREAALAPTAAKKVEALRQLAGYAAPDYVPALSAWRVGELYLLPDPAGTPVPVRLAEADAAGHRLYLGLDNAPVLDASGQPRTHDGAKLPAVDTNAVIRKAISRVVELASLGDADPAVRQAAVEKLGLSAKAESRAPLSIRQDVETNPKVRQALIEAIALIDFANGDAAARTGALVALVEVHSLAGKERIIERLQTPELPAAEATELKAALKSIEGYWSRVNFVGNLFRGLSLGSVLLVTALGLAITFGLMGVINMAHGELMVVGAYTTFLVQSFFIRWFGDTGTAFNMYFVVALPVAFLAAAGVGLLIERSIIQFLYKRPLESLLATWGVSLCLQQAFRVIFGPANVPIQAPSYLMGNFVIGDVIFAYNRVFVVGFAALVVLGVWLLLTRTPAGLVIRAVMQNRPMASCMGVRTRRVNMMTFAFGSGLAGLAGACLTQLGNVGPGLGQTHIVDCFMVVVSGGVGNILGTVAAALGIGTIDQILQPILGAVMGKILVLIAIILFLQWRPGGLFPTRSRSLD